MGLLGDIFNAFNQPAKEKGKAYAYLIFMGLLGGHEFYLDKWLRGMLYILGFILFMLGWHLPIVPFALMYIGSAMLVAFFLFDLFTLGKQVDKWNKENAKWLTRAAGKIAGNVISIPLKNAVEEYNGLVEGFNKSLADFTNKKSQAENLLKDLEYARRDTISIYSRMQDITDVISKKELELVRDELGEGGLLSEDVISQVLSGKDDFQTSFEQSIDAASQEMAVTFNAAIDMTQAFESNAGKFAAAAAVTVIQGLVEYGKQQEKIVELKEKSKDILIQQNELEIKIRQLEATEKRAREILRVIKAELPGFNHIYENFCAAVFPDGIQKKTERKTLTEDQRKMLSDLLKATSNVIKAGRQEINPGEAEATAPVAPIVGDLTSGQQNSDTSYDGTIIGGNDGNFKRPTWRKRIGDDMATAALQSQMQNGWQITQLFCMGENVDEQDRQMLNDLVDYMSNNHQIQNRDAFLHIIKRGDTDSGLDGWIVFSHFLNSDGWLHIVYYYAIAC